MTPSSFSERVTALINAGHDMTPEERVSAVNDLIESYVQATGDVPPDREVARLTNFILGVDLRSTNKRYVDRPIYTDEQLVRKDKRNGVTIPYDKCKNVLSLDALEMGEFTSNQIDENGPERRVHRAIKRHPDASDREIARMLGVSPSTVAKYRKTCK